MKRALVGAVDVARASEEFALACADCWGLIPFVGGGGNKGTVHKNAWNTLARETLETLHQTLTELFTNIPGSKVKRLALFTSFCNLLHSFIET
jgi:hypothetical protein